MMIWRTIALLALIPLAACTTSRMPVPRAPVVEQPQPLPDGVTPLTVEQDRQITG
jgi:hypothetical protein